MVPEDNHHKTSGGWPRQRDLLCPTVSWKFYYDLMCFQRFFTRPLLPHDIIVTYRQNYFELQQSPAQHHTVIASLIGGALHAYVRI